MKRLHKEGYDLQVKETDLEQILSLRSQEPTLPRSIDFQSVSLQMESITVSVDRHLSKLWR